MTAGGLRTPPLDVRAAAWWLGLGAACGALAGLVSGGIAGRLLMLGLRLESPAADGVTSDHGFEIGRVTASGSMSLAAFCTVLGAMVGIAYVLVRAGLPPRARVPLAALAGAAAGGVQVVDPDGLDLRILEPTWLGVFGFIALTGLAWGAIAWLVERRAARGRRPLPAPPPLAGQAARLAVTGLVLALIVSQSVALAGAVGQVL